MWRSHSRSTLALLTALLAFGALSCSSDNEKVVASWEKLGDIIRVYQDDCPALAQALSDFHTENDAHFSAQAKTKYQAIYNDPDLRLRMERAMAGLESVSFKCREDQKVQEATHKLFAEVLDFPQP